MSLNKKAIYWASLADQCQTEWVRKKYNQIVIFINIHFHHFTTICKGLYIYLYHLMYLQACSVHTRSTKPWQHSILPPQNPYCQITYCTYWKKKSLVSLVLHRLGLCLQFSPLFSRHMSFFCQIKFTFRQLASIENALITSINSNLGVNQFLHA